METGVFKQRFMGPARYLTLVAIFMFAGFQQVFAGADKLKHAEFEFHVGPAFPLGNFARTAFSKYTDLGGGKYSLSYNGAKIGVNYGLAFQYYVVPNWGVLVMFNGHSNKIDVQKGFSTYNSALAWNTDSKGKWSEFMAFAGTTYRCSITDWLVFSFRAYLGYAHIVAPFYSASAKNTNGTIYCYSLKSASDANFGFGAGGAFKFIIRRGFHLDVRCDYMGAVPFYFRRVKSTVATEIANVNVPDKEYRNTFHENFNMINLSFGFTVAF